MAAMRSKAGLLPVPTWLAATKKARPLSFGLCAARWLQSVGERRQNEHTHLSDVNKLHSTNLIVAALGGEGGGVFTNWLIAIAAANGWLAQTTFLAGVAQRTGATIYYIELMARSATQGQPPVMSLFPAPGDIDIAISSELVEAGRMLQRGFVTPERTTLISSTHRVYGITEKINLADGTINPQVLLRAANKYAKEFIGYDMQSIAARHEAVVSAVLLGALAGSGALPFSRQSFVDVVSKTDRAVAANMAAFEDSYQTARSAVGLASTGGPLWQEATSQAGQSLRPGAGATEAARATAAFQLPKARSKQGALWLERVRETFPERTHFNIYHGLSRTFEYQDPAYAVQYLDELTAILALDVKDANYELTNAVARHLALWMCFEDIARVAMLKTRSGRMDEMRAEVKADDGQIIHVTEYFKPRVEEVCAILPAAIGGFWLAGKRRRAVLGFFVGGGKKLRTDRLSVYLLLRFLGMLGRFRRASLGYRHEHRMMRAWLSVITAAAREDLVQALELARCGCLVKGYGDTRARTTSQLSAIVQKAQQGLLAEPQEVARLRTAALADDTGAELQQALASLC